MKAFIGQSFREEDAPLIAKITEFIKSLNIDCCDAKPAKNKKLEDKIVNLISECEIFIGIFTRNEPICKEKKKIKWWCKPRNINKTYTTSNWVIQESGFAIGKDKTLILLKENGVCELPKLQGNLEYISFNRGNPADLFLKINQMVNDMQNKVSGETTEISSSELNISDKIKSEEYEYQAKEKIEDEKNEILQQIYQALFADQDYAKAQEILDNETQTLFDKDDKVATHATILRHSRQLGNENIFEKLQELVKKNKDNPRVIKQLAHSYKEISEFKEAEKFFLLAAKEYDTNDAEEEKGFVDAHVQAAQCLVEDDFVSAISRLQKLSSNLNFSDSKAKIFKELAGIAKNEDDIERFFIYAETALNINPLDTELRFTLAYTYSQNKCGKLSLLHYKKLIDTAISSLALNNIGVQYDELKLSYKCIQSYYKSVGHNETLAMANLAHKYLNEGFIEQARELIDKANKLSNEDVKVDYRVGKAQERMNNLIEGENKKEKEILAEAKKEMKFRVHYSKAFCSEAVISTGNIAKTWKTPWGDLELKFDKNTNSFSINKNEKIEYTERYNHLLSSSIPCTKKYKNRHIKITGTIEKMSGKYEITVEDKIGESLLSVNKIHVAIGYMVINENYEYIEIMEKTGNNETKFNQWGKYISK